MPIDPVKIPQNVYVEDRIVGPLTLRQILMIAVGGGFSYMLYGSLAKANGGSLSIVPTVLVWIPCAVSVVFALVKINDLSLFRIVFLMFERINKPPRRTWGPRQGLSIHIRTGGAQEVERGEKQRKEEQQRIEEMAKTGHKIQELSSVLDRPLALLPETKEMPGEIPAPTEHTAADLPAPVQDAEGQALPARFPVDRSRIQADQPKKRTEINDLIGPAGDTRASGAADIAETAQPPEALAKNAPSQPEPPADLSAYHGVFRDISPQA